MDDQKALPPAADPDHFDVATGEYGSNYLLPEPPAPAPETQPAENLAPAEPAPVAAPYRGHNRPARFDRPALAPDETPAMEGTNKPTPVLNDPQPVPGKPGKRAVPEGLDYDRAFAFFKDLEHVNRKHPRRSVLHFEDRSTVVDQGNKATATTANHGLAAMRLVALATAKGWSSVKLDGPPEYVRAAMEQCALMGMVVEPKDMAQQKMLVQVQQEQLKRPGVGRIAQGTLDKPEPAKAPVTAPGDAFTPAAAAPVPSASTLAGKLDAKAAEPADETPAPSAPRRRMGM